jgi:hypothetical protein
LIALSANLGEASVIGIEKGIPISIIILIPFTINDSDFSRVNEKKLVKVSLFDSHLTFGFYRVPNEKDDAEQLNAGYPKDTYPRVRRVDGVEKSAQH